MPIFSYDFNTVEAWAGAVACSSEWWRWRPAQWQYGSFVFFSTLLPPLIPTKKKLETQQEWTSADQVPWQGLSITPGRQPACWPMETASVRYAQKRGGKDAFLTSICYVCVVWLFYCGKICINLKLPYMCLFKRDNKPHGARRWASLNAPHLEDDQQAQRFLGQNGIELSSGLGPDNAAAPAMPEGSRLRHRLGKQTELLSETTVSTYGESNKALN